MRISEYVGGHRRVRCNSWSRDRLEKWPENREKCAARRLDAHRPARSRTSQTPLKPWAKLLAAGRPSHDDPCPVPTDPGSQMKQLRRFGFLRRLRDCGGASAV